MLHKGRFFWLISFIIACGLLVSQQGVQANPIKDVHVHAVLPIHAHAYAVKKRAYLYTSLSFKRSVSAKRYLRTAWYRTQVAHVVVNGQKRAVFKLVSANGRHTYWVFHSQVKGIGSQSFQIKLPKAGNRFSHKRIGVFGDSIPSGWDGYHFYLNDAYPDWTRKYLGAKPKVHNEAVPSAQIVGHRFRYVGGKYNRVVPEDLSEVLKHQRKTIKKMNLIFVQICTNDYTNGSRSGSLQNVTRHLALEINYIHKVNPRAKVYGILPISRYDVLGRSCDHIPNMYGYTFDQLRAAEARTYRRNRATVVDFNQIAPTVISWHNRDQTLQDHKIHPTTQTAQRLGYALACWLIARR